MSSKQNGKRSASASSSSNGASISKRGKNVAAPVAQSRRRKTAAPKAVMKNGSLIVSHREYLSEVNGTAAFSLVSRPINPGLPSTFPWLAPIAARYETYRFRSLKFCFETEAPTSTAGAVMQAVDFDAADLAPPSKVVLMSYTDACRSAPWDDSTFSTPQHVMNVERYIRVGSLAANLDVKTYDVGNHFIATQGLAAPAVVGELYVEYVVELFTPQIQSSCPGGKVSNSGTTSIPNPWGVPVLTGPLPIGSVAGQVATFNQPGEFWCMFQGSWGGNAPVITWSADVTVTTLVLVNSAPTTSQSFIVRVNAGSTVTFTPTVIAPTTLDLRIAAYNYSNQ